MAVIIAHASINEHGRVSGGNLGDQTKKEVCTRTWYSKPWGCVIRFTDAKMRERVAECMEKAAANDNIGYDQIRRNTLLNCARRFDYDVSKVKEKCATDCSALVSLACIYAGIPENKLVQCGNSATTRTLRQALKATGEVDIYSTSDYTSKSDKLLRGDILLKEGAHVVVVVKTDNFKSIEEIAKEVKAGKWGNNPERKQRLIEAGYDYEAVRSAVNKLYTNK